MKKFIALMLSLLLCLTAVSALAAEPVAKEDLKVGFIYIGDENEGYTFAHYTGALAMQEELGLSDDQIDFRMNIGENELCYDNAADLADAGCQIVFGNSFGHESFLLQAAEDFEDTQFCHATGSNAADSGLDNIHNYFVRIHEARFVSGVVAGMKLNQLIEEGKITAEEAKIGYVGAYPYAEVISGFSAFFLGVRYVCPSATMEVKYTNSWASFDLEKETAEALIADKCVLISQHADTTGAATACEAAGIPIVGYNVDMIATAPNYALTSAANNWAPYVIYAVKCILNGEDIDTDWCGGHDVGAIRITDLNENAVAPGTAEMVESVWAAIDDGSLKVFDCSTFTVNGEILTSYDHVYGFEGHEMIKDGYWQEADLRSAPTFEVIIDGIEIK